ncbi:hypothetical protein SR86_12450 [Enterobacter hormaechei subsp. xiangfangensis]|uniref:hypothetical protein n=1 Tax=Enterobacter hormaechei TaxID=158836 RepID=UPI0005EDF5D3|nr:hypothetical protein [Enterobacter hormaechei]KJO32783.1 hypothetical protein SS01_08270 [Enterobacter hormaechei subsp. xiangfangensis]KJO88010.1 hypothetical protein SR86_12450 [Enterobacter hormaechei subsp. xiangfangensis]KJP01929.1 hypothetical protein SR95_12520 [Enterobacter hormaechei subsp. xiangfangensis]
MSVDLVHYFQEVSWYIFTGMCIVFGYAGTRWFLNTYFPERFMIINRYHNDELVSSHKVDLKAEEPLVRQLRELQKRRGNVR